MSDLRISQLPAATALGDTDLAPISQMGGTPTTRRTSLAQLRRSMHEGRSVHVRDFGAVGDGTTNDAPAIQAAIDFIKGRGGGVVQFGAQVYLIGGPVLIEGVTVRLQGQGFTEGPGPGDGTWLRVNATGFTPFRFTGLVARGSVVADIAVVEGHSGNFAPGWTPTAYDWFFRVENCLGGVDFDNVFFCAINRGVYCFNSGRCDFRRIRGQVFTAGIETDEALDVPRFHNIHYWPFWSANQHVIAYQQASGDALIFKRCDGPFIDQAFCLGYRSLFRFAVGATGRTTKFYIGQAYADFARYGIWVEAQGVDGLVANFTTHHEFLDGTGNPLPGSHAIFVDAPQCRIQMGNLRVDAVEDTAIRLNSHTGRLDLFAFRVVRYNTRNNGAPAIEVANAATGEPNRVMLGSPPILEAATPGPLNNTTGNGAVQMQGPAGRAARPGVATGEDTTGMFNPTAGAVALAAGGQEVLRGTAAGVTLGAAPSAHGFEVLAPVNAANRLAASGSIAGAAPELAAIGADTNVGVTLRTKGTGAHVFATGGGTQLRVANVAAAVNSMQVNGSATNATVGWLATGADANVSVAIGQPRGTGALLAQFPDGAAAGGGARGANAVDLQTTRAASTNVAAGAQSVIGGGIANTASGAQSVVSGGQANTASGTHTTISGGQGNLVSTARSWIPGGERGTTRANSGRGAWSAGRFAADGDAQAGEFILRVLTTTATAGRMTSDAAAAGSSNTANLPVNGTYRMMIMLVAQQTAGSAGTVGDCATWDFNLLVRRGGTAATTLVGGTTLSAAPAIATVTAGTPVAPDVRDAGAAAWTVTLSADSTNSGLNITCTGEANKSIRWVARIMSVEVTGL